MLDREVCLRTKKNNQRQVRDTSKVWELVTSQNIPKYQKWCDKAMLQSLLGYV